MTIAIDGHSSCGKSTLAKDLAKELNLVYIDTGAMYRGVTLYAWENGWITEKGLNKELLLASLNKIELTFQRNANDSVELLLNGRNVESEIREMRIANWVSEVAALPEVRKKLVRDQRKLGEEGGVVLDGRDIGSVVFPHAELKIFLTASPEVRAKRRFDELTEKGYEVSLEEVEKNLAHRDEIDSNREDSPLIQTEDAVLLDNSRLNRKEQVMFILNKLREISTV